MIMIHINGIDREATPEEEAQILADQAADIPEQAKRRIYTGFDAALNAPVTYNGATFDNRTDSRSDINGVITQITNGMTLPVDFAWRDANNVDHVFTLVDLQGLATEMFSNQWAAHYQKRVLLAQLEAATTPEEYEAIQWS